MERQGKKTRKIAVVIPKYGLVGGAEGFAAALTERLARDPALEIHVFANRRRAEKDAGPIRFHRVPVIPFPRCLRTPGFAVLAQRAIARAGVHIIHAHDRMFRPDLYTMHGIPHRFWVREVRKKRRPSLFDRATIEVEKRMVAGETCGYFLAVSHLAREIFLREYPIDPDRVPVIHPGIDPGAVMDRDDATERREAARRHGLPTAAPLIVFASMNFDIKGLAFLLAGLGRLKSLHADQDFHLLVAGGDDRRKYEAAARAAGIGDRVTFTGVVSREELASIYAAGDLYAMLSKFDTFGMVVLEAMAKGLPAVVSGNVGAKDLIREGDNGFVVPHPEDADRVAETIFQALRPERRIALRTAARATARGCSWEKTAGRVGEIYDRIISSKGIF
ncbi:MAG: glycosyltransferase family 4 protein [Pseudomonadota bacterium]|nr:glycosyltransferase family 4 protein [Pseudomonadota bacterium]